MEQTLTGPAAEVFMRLGSALEQASDYSGSHAAYQGAADYCDAQGQTATGYVCQLCLVGVFWRLGEWDKCIETGMGIVETPEVSSFLSGVARGVMGRIHALRGEIEAARPLMQETSMMCRRMNYFNGLLIAEWGLAIAAAVEMNQAAAREHWQQVIDAWEASDDIHYGIEAFRWGATQYAQWGDYDQVQVATSALGRIVAETSNPEALAGLAHGIGESTLLEGDPVKAVGHFEQAAALGEEIEAPFDQACTRWRLGSALAANGEHDRAVNALQQANKAFIALGARPLQVEVEKELIALGSQAKPFLKKGVARRLRQAGLTRRQLEVLGKLAQGMTNRQIAEELVLSPRTVEMHVANVLNKLGCNNRAEAVGRAAELGLLQDGS